MFKVKWGASSRWSSFVYFPKWNSDQMTIGKTRLTLIYVDLEHENWLTKIGTNKTKTYRSIHVIGNCDKIWRHFGSLNVKLKCHFHIIGLCMVFLKISKLWNSIFVRVKTIWQFVNWNRIKQGWMDEDIIKKAVSEYLFLSLNDISYNDPRIWGPDTDADCFVHNLEPATL